MQTLSKFASKLIKTCYLLDKITLFVQLLRSLFDSNSDRNGHTDHRVVTSSDENYHFDASVALAIASGWNAIAKKPCHISLFQSIHIAKSLLAEHIVLEFAECIILRFDVFANMAGALFAERLRFVLPKTYAKNPSTIIWSHRG